MITSATALAFLVAKARSSVLATPASDIAVKSIAADKRKYLRYFIDYHKAKDPEIAALSVDDLRESRLVVCDPAPIPDEELQRTYEWVKGWGMLDKTNSPLALVNMDVQHRAHVAAE